MTPADLPHNGRGGYLYTSPIPLPNYANTAISTSYAIIDGFLFIGSASATTMGVIFGACLMTLIQVLVFTTPDKRGRIIFNCIVVGLLLEVIRQFCGIWAVTRSGTNSSYFLLTLPSNNATEAENLAAANVYTNFSLGTKVNSTINELTSVLAFVAVQVCFYVLVYAMMSAMRRKTVHIVTLSLAGLGFHAVVWRFVQVVWNTVSVFHKTSNFAPPGLIQFGTGIAYTISICAWCLVYGYLVIRSVLSRVRMGLGFKRGETRHVMFMTALESMIIPLMFVVLQWISPSWFPLSEYCVVPSILLLLPFGTIWASSFDPNEAHRGHAGRYQPSENRGLAVQGSNTTATSGSAATDESPSQPLFERITTRAPSLSNTRKNPGRKAVHPSPPTPSTPIPHPLDDLYSDAESDGTIRIRRQFTVSSKPRSPVPHADERGQI